MKEQLNHLHLVLSIITIFGMICEISTTTCNRQRCCDISTCTTLYCQQQNSQTWISTLNYTSYQYTKLVMADNQCKPCAYNCKICDSQTICNTCYSGYYMDSNSNKCQPCNYKCLNCQLVNNLSKCSLCDIGSYLDLTTLSCNICPLGAQTCASNTIIQSCLAGYLKSSNSMFCTPCTNNCLTCPVSTTNCTVCNTGYYINSGLCTVCNIPNCLACTGVGTNVFCTACDNGFYKFNNTLCSACPSNCLSCQNSSACISCRSNYYIQNGGCSSVPTSVLISNCATYSNLTVSGGYPCSSCQTGFYLSSSAIQCIPCSIMCTSCYGNHFGLCTACVNNALLFNQMCVPMPYYTSTQMQIYYTAANNVNDFMGGTLTCSEFLYSGTTISLQLGSLSAYKLVISYRLFTDQPSQQYSIILNSTSYSSLSSNSSTTQINEASQLGYQICTQSNISDLFYSHVNNVTFNQIGIQNVLIFGSSLYNIYISEILVTAYQCSSLCLQCSQNQCYTCITNNLYIQEAYCVNWCDNGYYTYQATKQCVKQCPIATFPLLTNASCISCVSPCVTCLSDKFCLSCIEGYYLLSESNTCLQICPYQYFASNGSQMCQKCVGRCNDCIDDNNCWSCRVGFLQNTSCVDTCSNGLYQNIKTLQCQSCDSVCLTCQFASNRCITCPPLTLFYNNTCLSECPIGYFANLVSQQCLACSYPCQSCQNSSTSCSSCTDDYRMNDTCVSSCPTGYYQDNVLLQCQPCSQTCTKCDSAALNCQQCVKGYNLYKSSCLAVCPNGYFPQTLTSNITICSICSGLCKTCINQTFCLSCNSNFLADNNSGICVRSLSCSPYYYAEISTLKCEPCSDSCLTCFITPTTCTSCVSPLVIYNTTCISECPSSFYYIDISLGSPICSLCQEPCITCISQNQCLSCVVGYKYSSIDNVCSSTCSIGQFFNSTINECQTCSVDCLTCDSALFCYACSTNTFLYVISTTSNKCVSSCPPNFYTDSLSCMPCLFPCSSCTSSIDCLSCQSGVLYQNRCLTGCPDSTFMNTTNNTCISCEGDCLTCKEISTQCTLCLPGLYLMQPMFSCFSTCPNGTYSFQLSKTCMPCPSFCSSCLNTSYCTTCVPGKTYLNVETNMCTQYCASGQFSDIISGSCLPCNSKCQSCSGSATQCQSCTEDYLLLRMANFTFDCVQNCPSLYYNDSNACYQCIFPCLQCKSTSQCLTCVPGTYYHSSSQSCLMQCPIGTFYDTSTSISLCTSCTNPCATCTKNTTNCISCVTGYFLFDGSCTSSCPIKFYADPSGICNRCYGVCQTCSGKYECITCLTGFAYSGYCYSACPPGTFASQQSKTCEACQSPCLQCAATATYCKRCQFNMYAYRGECSTTCPNGTFESGQNCQSCQFPCISCSNQITCDKCIGGYLLYMNTSCIANVDVCPNGLYKLDSIACVPSTWCPSDYYRDEDMKVCSKQCSPQKYVDMTNKLCLYNCYNGEYVGQQMVCENWVQSPPKSLMAMRGITFIKNSQVYIVIMFNQTERWLQKSQNMYGVISLDLGRRLLQTITTNIKYVINQKQEIVLQIVDMPFYVEINLPAYYVVSAQTNYNLQNPNVTLQLPAFIPYTYQQVYMASNMAQLSEGISWFIILFSIFFLYMNRLSDAYILWDSAQLLYLLIFLNIQYPPNLNDFLTGMSNTHFLFVPSIFSNIVPQNRLISSPPFYAYAFDNSFLRTAGSPILLIVIAIGIFLVLKTIQIVMKNFDKIRQKFDEYPTIKGYIFKGLLRYRWHHTSDIFFLSYDIIMLFAVAQIYNIAQNPKNILSNVLCIVIFIIYLAFPLFISYKLYKHYQNIAKGKLVQNLQCFYRGIDKTNKFGISLILIRYFRKLTYCLIIGLFTQQPMFAIPILMFTSVLMGIFILINRPFKKRLSNIITILTQIILMILFILIALIQFGYDTMTTAVKITLGWICCVLLILMLLMLIFEIFCKSMFYLQPQKSHENDNKQIQHTDTIFTKKFNEQYLRQKAKQFFQFIFPKIKSQFNLDQSEDNCQQGAYEDGDSENSENNQERLKCWGIYSDHQSKRSDQFRHYENQSEEGSNCQIYGKNINAPNYLIRCVNQIK